MHTGHTTCTHAFDDRSQFALEKLKKSATSGQRRRAGTGGEEGRAKDVVCLSVCSCSSSSSPSGDPLTLPFSSLAIIDRLLLHSPMYQVHLVSLSLSLIQLMCSLSLPSCRRGDRSLSFVKMRGEWMSRKQSTLSKPDKLVTMSVYVNSFAFHSVITHVPYS